MTHIANDNSDDVATNLFKRVKVTESHYYNQKFRSRLLYKMELFISNPDAPNHKNVRAALLDWLCYKNDAEVHPLDLE